VGGAMKRGEEDFFLFLPKAIKVGTFHGPPSLEPFKGHQTLEPFIGHQTLEPFIGHQTLELFIGH